MKAVSIVPAVLILAGCVSTTPISEINRKYAPYIAEWEANYRIKADDRVATQFYGEADLGQDVPVLRDGKVDLYYLDDFKAAGLTPEEFEEKLKEGYKVEVKEPVTSVVVSPAPDSIYVTGEVGAAAAIPITKATTAREAIARAGGVNYTGRDTVVWLIRPIHRETPDLYRVDLSEYTEDLVLLPNDHLHVPRTIIWEMNLFVRYYILGLLPIPPYTIYYAAGATGGGGGF